MFVFVFAMDDYLVHNVPFLELQRKAIQALAYNDDDDNCKVALAREDHSIEIWDVQHGAYQEKVIAGPKKRKVRALAWFGSDRLFGISSDGILIEYDLLKLRSKAEYQVTSGACWCMKLGNYTNRIAVETYFEKSSCIKLYRVVDQGLEFDRTFVRRKDRRVICLAWHQRDRQLASGAADTIDIWNVNDGKVLRSIKVGRDRKRTATVVWCIEFTSDFQIISGDSRGKLCFWDAESGTLIHCIKTHRACVLTLCLNKAEDAVYASGVDPNICCVERMIGNGSEQKLWAKTLTRCPHTHTVRGLVLAGEHLISGGFDAYLVQMKFKPNIIRTWSPPIPQTSPASLVPHLNLVLLRYPSSLELWRLGTSKSGELGQVLPLPSHDKKLMVLQAKPTQTIVCCAISDDARYLAFSTNTCFRLVMLANVNSDDGKKLPSPRGIPFSPPGSQRCHHLAFIPRTPKLVLIKEDGAIQVVGVDRQPQLVNTLDPSHEVRIHLVALSCNGRYLATANHWGTVDVFELSTLELHWTLPKPWRSQATALAFSPNNRNLVATYTDKRLVEFDIDNCEITEWSRAILLNSYPWRGMHPILGIAFDPRDPNVIFAYDSHRPAVVVKDEVLKRSSRQLGCYQNSQQRKDNCSDRSLGIHYSNKYEHIVHVGLAGERRLVITQVDQSKLIDNLKPKFVKICHTVL